ncbi:hypothetical protein [Paenibacillus swuensis]|uniref:hypothetical protein n=1 Tax=Paenibacillus swuensis TaxID=1178515 RepID=UPI000837E95F|nr:hypothetical protein [Paenibacillus swuensis]
MNISHMVRSMVGELTPAEGKQLELKAGQIVRGKVVQVTPETSEALVNINGALVKAKLETPMQEGQVTMLQVQPESSNGQVVLKPVALSTHVPMTDESIGELLKSLGLQDLKQGMGEAIIRMMHKEGIPLTKDDAQAFKILAQAIPSNVSDEEWLLAGALAWKRGLPLTQQTVASLHQVLFGKDLGNLLQGLNAQLQLLSGTATGAAGFSAETTHIMKQLDALSKQMYSETSSVKHRIDAEKANVMTGKPIEPIVSGKTNLPASTVFTGNTAANTVGSSGTNADTGKSSGAPASNGSTSDASKQSVRTASDGILPNEAEQAVENKNIRQPGPGTGASAKEGSTITFSPSAKPAPEIDGLLIDANLESPSTKAALANQLKTEQGQRTEFSLQSSKASKADETLKNSTASLDTLKQQPLINVIDSEHPWVSKIMKLLGVEHEQAVVKQIEQGIMDRSTSSPGTPLGTLLSEGKFQQHSTTDTIKSLLLQLAQGTDLPPAVRDTVQQALQQVTGQQLLMTPDKNPLFTHLTLFIPFLNESGEETASVHIQSRKGSKGELDKDNCRLLFDLKMKVLGDTLVDVQVMNNIVSLKVHNDQPETGALLEMSRQDIAASVEGIGYQFLSMKCVPYPKAEPDPKPEQSLSSGLSGNLTAQYTAQPYKRMDFRI